MLNAHRRPAAPPFRIFAFGECDNTEPTFVRARQVWDELVRAGAHEVFIVDAAGVDVRDSEMHAVIESQVAQAA